MGKTVIRANDCGATLKKVTERSGKNGPYLMWEFQDDGGERKVGFTDSEVILGNRTWTWLHMLGISLNVGDTIELQDLQDIECFIFLDDKGTVRMVTETLTPEQVDNSVEPNSGVVTPVVTPELPEKSEAEGLFS